MAEVGQGAGLSPAAATRACELGVRGVDVHMHVLLAAQLLREAFVGVAERRPFYSSGGGVRPEAPLTRARNL
jgi:hypothetical protein